MLTVRLPGLLGLAMCSAHLSLWGPEGVLTVRLLGRLGLAVPLAHLSLRAPAGVVTVRLPGQEALSLCRVNSSHLGEGGRGRLPGFLARKLRFPLWD